MSISVFDLFTIGIGPSSSHTVGPMRAARRFADELAAGDGHARVARINVQLFGSLGATGRGHGTDRAILLGLEGDTPESVVVDTMAERVQAIRERCRLVLHPTHREIEFDPKTDLLFEKRVALDGHPNGMRFTAYDRRESPIAEQIFYSVGGGFVLREDEAGKPLLEDDATTLPLPFASADELLARCESQQLPIWAIVLRNEVTWRRRRKCAIAY